MNNMHSNPHWKIGKAQRDINNNNNKMNPGPGQYTLPYSFPNGPKYSISSKAGATDLTKFNCSPGPAQYEPKYKDGNPKYSMRIKPQQTNKSELTPGPGNYEIRTDKSLQCPSYKFGKEKKEGLNLAKAQNTPGPGNYEYESDALNITNPKFSFGKGIRRETQRPKTPGPGQYEYKNYIGKEAPKISMSMKLTKEKSESSRVPGPGHYNQTNYNSYKTKSPSYRIGSAKREGIYKYMESNPGPGQYLPDSCSNQTRPKTPSWKIGTSKRSPLNPSDPSIPGPGNYNIGENLGKRGPKYSIVGKHKNGKNIGNGVPGPGRYESCTVNKTNNPAWKIGTGNRNDDLRRKIKEGVPGPGKYEYGIHDKTDGPKFKFGTGKRGTELKNDVPGPGQYHIPCSIIDINDYTREAGKFDPQYRYI